MKTALALCLILGTLGPAWAQGKGQPVYVTPFTVLENHPSCNGTGKIAFQVTFAVKGAMARFGVAGQPKADARACSIRTRRGADVMEIPIPCPEVDAPARAAQTALDDLPRQADLSGLVIGCMQITGVSFVEGSWTLRVPDMPNLTELQGDLTSPGPRVLFSGVRDTTNVFALSDRKAAVPKLAVLWDELPVTLPDRPDQAVTLSAFVVLAPETEDGKLCVGDYCQPWTTDARWIVHDMGNLEDKMLTEFVEGK